MKWNRAPASAGGRKDSASCIRRLTGREGGTRPFVVAFDGGVVIAFDHGGAAMSGRGSCSTPPASWVRRGYPLASMPVSLACGTVPIAPRDARQVDGEGRRRDCTRGSRYSKSGLEPVSSFSLVGIFVVMAAETHGLRHAAARLISRHILTSWRVDSFAIAAAIDHPGCGLRARCDGIVSTTPWSRSREAPLRPQNLVEASQDGKHRTARRHRWRRKPTLNRPAAQYLSVEVMRDPECRGALPWWVLGCGGGGDEAIIFGNGDLSDFAATPVASASRHLQGGKSATMDQSHRGIAGRTGGHHQVRGGACAGFGLSLMMGLRPHGGSRLQRVYHPPTRR